MGFGLAAVSAVDLRTVSVGAFLDTVAFMPVAVAHAEYLRTITEPKHREKMEALLAWVSERWPELEAVVKWNQPMFTHHGTFIIGFSVFPKNIAVSPEDAGMERFRTAIEAAGYTTTRRLFRVRWEDPIQRDLFAEIIEWQLSEKADVTTFWRR